ncbi:MAG TPA: response regulator transcription factor [Candidatus Binataceae bacterium]|nr:response regulator transcription factor [Candidatus Binataceae bacterium]
MSSDASSHRSIQPLHLLVVEDEIKLLNNLCRGLGEEGFAVLSAGSAEAAERAIANGEFDAIVLDLRLPGKDGLEFLRGLRAAGDTTPVLVLTARGSVSERVVGLETGADDYLVKPFAFPELVARIRALARRRVGATPATLRVADLEFDSVRRRARRADRELSLSPKETVLLELLMRNAGQVVTRAMIAEVVWGFGYNDFSNLIEVFVNRLRHKIDDGGPPLIATVRGVGYSMRRPE